MSNLTKKELRKLYRQHWPQQMAQVNYSALQKNIKKYFSYRYGRQYGIRDELLTSPMDGVCQQPQEGASRKKNKNILVYKPMPEELPILDLLSFLRGWNFFLPQIRGQRLIACSLGGSRKIRINANNFRCIVVPGLFVDHYGTRLGRGKGYYDRTLRFFKFHQTVFVAANWQVIPNDKVDSLGQTTRFSPRLPKKKFDYRVGRIVCEEKIYRVCV